MGKSYKDGFKSRDYRNPGKKKGKRREDQEFYDDRYQQPQQDFTQEPVHQPNRQQQQSNG